MLIVLIGIQSFYVNKKVHLETLYPYLYLNTVLLSSYQSNNVVVYHCFLDLCDHIAAQIRSHTITDHNMLYTAYSWICQSCIVQSTFNSNETLHWCLLTLIILADYLTATIHDN